MKKIILAIFFLLWCLVTNAQNSERIPEKRPLSNINLNFTGGESSMVSMNYERLFSITKNIFIAGKFGLGLTSNYSYCFGFCGFGSPTIPKQTYLTVPHHVTINFGIIRNSHFLEMGVGGSFVVGKNVPSALGEDIQRYFIYPMIGYRYQGLGTDRTNFIFRIFAASPFLGIFQGYVYDDFYPQFFPVGITIGINLKDKVDKTVR